MTNADDFGISLVFDQPTGYVLLATKNNEIAHFICSAVLDTATHLYMSPKGKLLNYPELCARGGLKIVVGVPSQDQGPLPPAAKMKQQRVNLIHAGCVFLFGQAAIIESTYDGFDFLSSEDLPFYLQNKTPYVELYSQIHSVSHEIALKQLDFLAENLLNVKLRKKELVQKYASGLRAIETQEQYDEWYNPVFNEAIGLGRV